MLISKEVKIGAVFFIAIVILVVFAVAVGALTLGGGHGMTVYFDEVLGLEPGNDVWLYGKKVGAVRSLTHALMTTLDGKQAFMVKVVLNLDNEIALYDDYGITVVDKSVIGGRAVQIRAGTPGKPAHTGTIYGSSRSNPLATMGEEFTESLRVVDAFVDLIHDLQEGKGTLGMLITDDALYQELVSTTTKTGDVLELLTAEESTFRSLLEDRELPENIRENLAQMRRATQQFAELMEKINSPDSFIRRLATDTTLFQRLDSLVKNLDEFSRMLGSGKGLGRALTDENLYRDIAEIVAETRRTVRIARELMAEVQRDPQMLIAGRPTGKESWLVRQLRGEVAAPAPRAVLDRRKLVPDE